MRAVPGERVILPWLLRCSGGVPHVYNAVCILHLNSSVFSYWVFVTTFQHWLPSTRLAFNLLFAKEHVTRLYSKPLQESCDAEIPLERWTIPQHFILLINNLNVSPCQVSRALWIKSTSLFACMTRFPVTEQNTKHWQVKRGSKFESEENTGMDARTHQIHPPTTISLRDVQRNTLDSENKCPF